MLFLQKSVPQGLRVEDLKGKEQEKIAQPLLVYHLPLLFFIFKSVVAKASRESVPGGTDKDWEGCSLWFGVSLFTH